ncbi:hypothetical protein EXU29_17010 [Acinetobacter wuhouensis]|uniref:PIN domain-containing protein n=1 Tax=Acinetobacter wuhouensis TaxID=1879050 RepID=UPI001023AB26|nr:hypothetical protein [Acinetobacter wuhouensis]RZG69686.1 hypothetical protein EXU29_17010 [Acinetobacter wuhouensis]
MIFTSKIDKPNTEQDFESLCAHVLGKIFNCTLPSMYGRRGQSQHGLDILVYKNDKPEPSNRIGIQCKHVQKLTFNGASGDSVIKEVKKADLGKQDIKNLIIVTSLDSDKSLTDDVSSLSDQRSKEGKFSIQIIFWNDICNYINRDPELSAFYGQNSEILDSFFKEIDDLIKDEKYKTALTRLNSNKLIDQYNVIMRYKKLFMQANCSLGLGDFQSLDKTLNELDKFEWKDTSYNILKISKLINTDIVKAKEELKENLLKEPLCIELKILDYYFKLIIDNESIEYKDVDRELLDNEKILYYFLVKASNTANINLFNEIYNKVTPKQKTTLKYKLLYNACKVNIYSKNSDLSNKIELINSFELLKPYQKTIWEIETKNDQQYFIKICLTTFELLEDVTSIHNLFTFLETSDIEISNENLIIFLFIFQKFNLVNLFTETAKKYFDQFEIDFQMSLVEYLIGLKEFTFVKSKITYFDLEDKNYIQILLWTKELNIQDFIQEITRKNALNYDFLGSLIVISRHLFNNVSGDNELYNQYNDKIKKIYKSNEEYHAYVAEYFFLTKQFKLAIETYKKTVKTLTQDDQIKLFECYIKTGNFIKATELFQDSLVNLNLSLKIVNLCYEMARKTLDWSLCELIVKELESTNLDQAWLWNMKLTIVFNTKNKYEHKSLIRSIPEALYGNSDQICWLVAQEVHHNFIKKARNRLIKLWRSNLNDIEAEKSIYKLLLSFITAPKTKDHPFFSETYSKIGHGVVVSIKYGKSIETKVIDIEDYKESPPNFINLNSEYGKEFLEKSVGDTISLIDKFGVSKEYEILAIKPILLHVWETFSQKVHEINNPFDFLTSIESDLDSEEGRNTLFNTFKVMQDQRHDFLKNAINMYKNHPLTVYRFAKYISISIVELVYQWHNNFIDKLYSIDNKYINEEAEYQFSQSEIKNLDRIIIDLYSLIELKFFNKLNVLDRFEEIYISKVTYSELKDLIELQERELSEEKKGTLQVINGVPRIIENDKNQAKKILIDLQEILDFIDNKNFICEASYGDGNTHELDDVLVRFLTTSETSTITLAREKKIPVCSFDARLRALIHQYGMETINLDDVIVHDSNLSKNIFPLQKFVHNRTIENRYFERAPITIFFLEKNENLISFFLRTMQNTKELSEDQALELYRQFLMLVNSSDIKTTYGALDILNKAFMCFYIQVNPANDLNNIRQKLSKFWGHKLDIFSAFSCNLDEISMFNIYDLKINKVTMPPTIFI